MGNNKDINKMTSWHDLNDDIAQSIPMTANYSSDMFEQLDDIIFLPPNNAPSRITTIKHKSSKKQITYSHNVKGKFPFDKFKQDINCGNFK